MTEEPLSDATIVSLVGHLSREMMELYSHTRNQLRDKRFIHPIKTWTAVVPTKL